MNHNRIIIEMSLAAGLKKKSAIFFRSGATESFRPAANISLNLE